MNRIVCIAGGMAMPILIALIFIIPDRLSGQGLPPAPPCDSCYKGFLFDSTFQIGAHFNGSWDSAAQYLMDSLHITITQLYSQPNSLQEVFDSTDWGMDDHTRWANRERLQFWKNVADAEMGVILLPGWIPAITKHTEMSEAFFGQAGKDAYLRGVQSENEHNDTLHRIDFFDYTLADSLVRPTNSLIWGGLYRKAASDTLPKLMAGGHQYTTLGLQKRNGLAELYTRVGHAADSNLYDIALALRVDEDSATFANLSPDTLLAFAEVYRRIAVGQDSCGCNLYEVVDTLEITKQVYLDPLNEIDSNGYRNIVFSLSFPEPTFTPTTDLVIERSPSKMITALEMNQTYPKYTSRGGFKSWHSRGQFQGNEADTVNYGRYCERLKDSLSYAGRGYYTGRIIDHDELIPYSDLSYNVYTTRKANVVLLRGRVAPHTYTLLRNGAFDSLIAAEMDAVLNDSLLNARIVRFGASDEQAVEKYRGHADVVSRMQRHLLSRDSTDTRGFWANPIGDEATFRVHTGDLDTTEIRMVHMTAHQVYNFNGRLPVAHVFPDSMQYSPSLNNGLYHVQSRTDPPYDEGRWQNDRMLAFNSIPDYEGYTAQTLDAVDHRRKGLVTAVNASRTTFRHIRSESYPVYSVVHIMGYIEALTDANGNDIGYSSNWRFRPTTPEEITVQAWMILHCGLDGMWFGDFTFDDAREFGVVHAASGDHSANFYDSLNSGDLAKQNNPNWKLPKIWTGFKDRFDAIKRITTEFHDKILPAYTKLDRNGVSMAPYRDSNFADMPLLDTLFARHAERNVTTPGQFEDSVADATHEPVNDPRDSTYIETTVYQPGLLDSNQLSTYLLVSNLRCWPIDSKTYSSYVDSLYQLNSPGVSNEANGFGAIDVRKPIVVLKNQNSFFADSARIERIGYSGTARTVLYGDTVHLDWLTPGWGAMYRVTPIPALVSQHGTAWNNGVHGENPSHDTRKRDGLVVYERDSAVYLRAYDATGSWSREWMISDAADTAIVGTMSGNRRLGHNFTPTLAVIRSDSAAAGSTVAGLRCLVAWERRDTNNRASVELMYFHELPTRAGGLPTDRARKRLSSPSTLQQSWMVLAPAVVGVDSGWVVAWGAPDGDGTLVKAVRYDLDASPYLNAYDTSANNFRVRMRFVPPQNTVQWMGGNICQYPTLAYRRHWDTLYLNGGTYSQTFPGLHPNSSQAGAAITGVWHAVRLAYQQGKPNNTIWAIMYNTLGVYFPPPPSGSAVTNPSTPQIWASPTEWVSYKIPGCKHIHPSIATDSALTAVAFESVNITNVITLRFRDTIPFNIKQPQTWNTRYYKWGGVTLRNLLPPRFSWAAYTRPSVTQFPALRRSQLKGIPEGGLVWQWTNAPENRRNRLLMYHYGNTRVDTTLADGQDPTMMLSSNLSSSRATAFKSATILHRGSLAERQTRMRSTGDSAFYYPAYGVNLPKRPAKPFLKSTRDGDSIVGTYWVGRLEETLGSSCPTGFDGIHIGTVLTGLPPVTRTDVDSTPTATPSIPPATGWGLPPAFFATPPSGPGIVATLADAGEITRTGVFRAGSSTVSLRRIIVGGDSVIAWLNTQPMDTASGLPANIMFNAQIVRASDGAILWYGDTISARRIASDTIDEVLSIPVPTYAPADTAVFIRLHAASTPWLKYEMIGGFEFSDLDENPAGGVKPVSEPEDVATPVAGEEAIAVEMIPNPVHASEGELRIQLREGGAMTIVVYDVLGNMIDRMEYSAIEGGKEYSVPVDLSELEEGRYLVEVRQGETRGITWVTVLR